MERNFGKNRWCLTSIWALALAAVMLLAGPALAQTQGGSPAGQGNQLCTPGPGGTCAVNPPNKPGKQNCPATGCGQSPQQQGSQAPGGAGSGSQPQIQANPPATSK